MLKENRVILIAAVIAQKYYWECIEFITTYSNSMKQRDSHKISFNRKYELLILFIDLSCLNWLWRYFAIWTCYIWIVNELLFWFPGEVKLIYESYFEILFVSLSKHQKQQDYHRYGQLVTIKFLNPYSASEQEFPFIFATTKVPYRISRLGYSSQWSLRLGVAPGFPSSAWTYASQGVDCPGPCPHNMKKTCLWPPRF